MPYKTSKARKTLQVELKGVIARVRIAQKKEVDPNIREYVFAASIFLAHASLENYISDVFSGFASGVQSLAVNGSALPESLRAHLFLHKINKPKIYGAAIGLNSEQEALSALSNALNGHAGTVVDNSKTIYAISGRDIYTTNKYPSKDNIIKIFERIGVPKVFNKLSAKMKRDSSAVLESLGSLRTQLAHTGQIPGVSARDIVSRFNDIESFAGAIDRTIYQLVSSKYGQGTWDSHVA